MRFQSFSGIFGKTIYCKCLHSPKVCLASTSLWLLVCFFGWLFSHDVDTKSWPCSPILASIMLWRYMKINMTMLSICYQNILSGWGFWSKMNQKEIQGGDPVDSPTKSMPEMRLPAHRTQTWRPWLDVAGNVAGRVMDIVMDIVTDIVMDIEFQTSQTSIIKPSNGTKDRHRPLSIPESSAIHQMSQMSIVSARWHPGDGLVH